MPFDDELYYLKRSNLFSELSDDDLLAIAARLQQKVYPANTIIVKEGGPGDAMFIIREGEVQVRRREETSGSERFITTLRAGDCFGEIGLLTGRPRSATVATLLTTEVYVLTKDDLRELMGGNTLISASVGTIINRMEDMNTQKASTGVISLRSLAVKADVLSRIPRALLMEHRILPIGLSATHLTLAMVNPTDLLAQDHATRFVKGLAIKPVKITDEDFEAFLKSRYSLILKGIDVDTSFDNKNLPNNEVHDFAADFSTLEDRAETAVTIGDAERDASQAPVIRLAHNIIEFALKSDASDIHVEPTEKGVRLRYRIDGVLREEKPLPRKVLLPLVSRFKIMSLLDITERRIPQDGRISLKVGGRTVDFRISTMPSKYGEKIAIRILDQEAQVLSLEELISHLPTLALVRQMTRKPYGIIYVTGPTGSGKTTTLYSALAELNSPEVNILTAEDPVEYDLPGITQVQVNHDIGLDFARVIKAFLRQDPDIILVGETRDQETAKTAVQAALTGHLVFTTVHTNDAPSTFVRLSEMGVEPYLISTSLIGVIAQRLLRRICTGCREPIPADQTAARFLGLKEGTIVYKGMGCDECNQTGYRGRTGVYEVLMANEEIRHMVAQGTATERVREKAIELGMVTMKEYALTLLAQGTTTVDEVLRTVAVEK
jgi:type IV pilus assembly protein PilB